MEHQPITFNAINRSPDKFYRHVYPVLTMDKDQLINLDQFQHDRKIFIVDSCGWYYKTFFPNHNISGIEGIEMCKNLSMDREKFDFLFDDRVKMDPKFSNMESADSVLVYDHGVLLRYTTPDITKNILDALATKTLCSQILVRLNLQTIGHWRFDDRVEEMRRITPTGFVVSKFLFDVESNKKIFIGNYVRKKSYLQYLD